MKSKLLLILQSAFRIPQSLYTLSIPLISFFKLSRYSTDNIRNQPRTV